MSMVLRTKLPVNAGVSITVGAAIAVQKAIASYFGIDTDIKWVNDLYYRNKKICGILAEGFDITQASEGKPPHFGFIILGIGINISKNTVFPDELKDIAGTLELEINTEAELHKVTGDLSELIQKNITGEILAMKYNMTHNRTIFSKEFTEYYNHRFIAKNKAVTVGDKKGKALGIDGNGCLILETPSGEKEIITSGELSLRPI